MAIGIVNDSDFDSELSILDIPNPVPNATVKDIKKGRGEGDVETPEVIRKIIGDAAIEGGRAEALALADRFGLSGSSASAYANGATSTSSYHNPSLELSSHLNNKRIKIASKARARLLASLNAITPEKLENAKLRDVAAVATAMSAIVKHMEPEVDRTNLQNVQFVFMSPRVRHESEYEYIDVQASE